MARSYIRAVRDERRHGSTCEFCGEGLECARGDGFTQDKVVALEALSRVLVQMPVGKGLSKDIWLHLQAADAYSKHDCPGCAAAACYEVGRLLTEFNTTFQRLSTQLWR